MRNKAEGFGRVAAALAAPAVDVLAGRLAGVGLDRREQTVILSTAQSSLTDVVRLRLTRTLLLELHAARLTGRLTGQNSLARWEEFLDLAERPEFLRELRATYPALADRLATLLAGRVSAALELAARIVADRERLRQLGAGGPLEDAEFGAGDSHAGGRTVVRLRFGEGRAIYKPRSLAVDRALAALLADIQPGNEIFIKVPRVLEGAGYGWAEFVEHRFCANQEEVRSFYFGMGMWLAVTRLLAGTDLHAENLIASGPVPVVVDCETLFSPRPAVPSFPVGATRKAWARLADTLTYSMLLPWRETGSPLAGVDLSALGALVGEQPQVPIPAVDGIGTDEARLVMKKVDIMTATRGNHPTPEPEPRRFVTELLEGLREGIARINSLDRSAGLLPALDRFAGCTLRYVPRSTQRYVDLGRALWHPASLHDQASAVERVTALLSDDAGGLQPGFDDAVIRAEIEELLVGDIPVFTFTPDSGKIVGPGGVPSGEHGNLIAASLRSWQALDVSLEEYVVKTSLSNASLGNAHNASSAGERRQDAPRAPRKDDLYERRDKVVRSLAEDLCCYALWGEDGTVTWLGSSLEGDACRVAPLGPDLYGGQAGVVLALAAYQHAVARRAVEPSAEVARVLPAAIQTLDVLEAEYSSHSPIGAYAGHGSLVLARLVLHQLGHDEQLVHARSAARRLNESFTEETPCDVIAGLAGAISSLVMLAERTGNARYLATAGRAADALARRARRHADGSCSWATDLDVPDLGGFSHGSTGIGWALARLGLATGESRFADLAQRAFAFEETLYSPQHGWRDLRWPTPVYPQVWCHGSLGIGLANLDLYRRTGDPHHHATALRAADHVVKTGLSRRHDPCHGDTAALEFLHALSVDHTSYVDEHDAWLAQLLADLEESGPLTGTAEDQRTPTLMTGIAGILYQLLRTHPRLDIPSLLLPGLAKPQSAARS